MALSERQRERLERLSIEKEGVAFVNKSVHITPTPTILISLGGLGGETLNELKKKMLRYLGPSDHIFYLAIDSDEQEGLKNITRSKSASGYLENNEVIGIYDPSTSQILMNGGRNRPSYTYKWMKNPFPETQLDDRGAQGVRQIGRMMLTCGGSYTRLRNRLNAILTQVTNYQTVNGNSDIEVILIAGVSGGTGSGTVIDVSYLIRIIMEQNHISPSAYNLSAYIYTPDVQFNEVGIKGQDPIISNLRRNGYSAIKEIDYFMNLTNHHGKYSLDLGVAEPYECSENIYDSCTIVTGLAAAGGMFTKRMAIDNLTENLLDLLTDIVYTDGGVPVQMAKAFSSNKRTNLGAWYNATGVDPKQFPKSANYCYQVLGYSSVRIPKDEILAYCVNKMFQKVHEEFNRINQVDSEMVTRVMSLANVTDAETLETYAYAMEMDDPIQQPMIEQSEWPSRRAVKDGTDTTLSDAMILAQNEASKVKNKVYIGRLKSAILSSLNREIDNIFNNYGPYFVVELLTHRTDKVMPEGDSRTPFAGILERLSDMATIFQEKANGCYGASRSASVQGNLQQLAEDAEKMGFGAKERMAAYVEYNCRVAWKEVFLSAFYMTLQQTVTDIIAELTEVNNTLWEIYTDVLDAVSAILEKDAIFVTSAERQDNSYSYSVLNLYEGNTKTNRLKQFLDGLISNATISELCNDFIMSMRNKRNQWTEMQNMEQFDVVTEVRGIFDRCLAGALKTDIIEKFVVAAYSPQNLTIDDIDRIWAADGPQKQTALQLAAQEIKLNLDNRGGLMASPKPGYTVDSFLDKKLVAALEETPALSKELFALYPTGSISQATSNGLPKYISSHIVFCVPLYLFEGFKECDAVYRQCIVRDKGMHMDEVQQDWRRFPQIYNLDIAARDGMPYEEFEDYQILMEIKREADLAMNTYGFIKKESSGDAAYTLYEITKKPENMEDFREKVKDALSEDGEKSLFEILTAADSGYRMEKELIELDNSALEPLDLEGKGRHLEVGDFYKLVRMSIRYMDLIKENLEIWEEADAIYQEEQQKIAVTIAYQGNLRTFANSIKTGLVGFEGDDNAVMYYTARGSREVLADMRAEDYFDKTHIFYNAFREFCKLPSTALGDMRKTSRRMIETKETVDISAYTEKLDDLLGEDGLGSIYAKDDVKEDVMSSELDYTFTDDVTVKGAYNVLLRFYKNLKRRLA